jgi:phospholipid transport system substrate-binding protein
MPALHFLPRFFLALALVLGLAFAAAPAAAKETEGPAAQFVQRLGDKALTSLTDRDIGNAERARRVRTLLRDNFDIRTIGRYVLGTHWREATDAQKEEYFHLFEDMIVATYTQRFAEYSGQAFKITGATAPEAGSEDSLINSRIIQKNGGPPVDVDWRVRSKNGQMRIVDVLVDSISMSVTQRSEFDSVIEKGGGKFDALLASLRQHKAGDK